jgi:hypothetical protein
MDEHRHSLQSFNDLLVIDSKSFPGNLVHLSGGLLSIYNRAFG